MRAPQLGERGGGWVVLQFVLLAVVLVVAVVGPGWPDAFSPWLEIAGAALVLAGVVVGVLSARALGRSLTPFPRPSDPATFVERGPYRVVRHPIYGGGLLILIGVSLLLSPWALVPTAALAVTWGMKSSVEERFLRAHYPEYDAYASRVGFRLIPFVY